jgi:hypothetical protein
VLEAYGEPSLIPLFRPDLVPKIEAETGPAKQVGLGKVIKKETGTVGNQTADILARLKANKKG